MVQIFVPKSVVSVARSQLGPNSTTAAHRLRQSVQRAGAVVRLFPSFPRSRPQPCPGPGSRVISSDTAYTDWISSLPVRLSGAGWVASSSSRVGVL